MKRIGYVYEKMCDQATVRTAIMNASKGKRKRHDVKRVINNMDTHVQAVIDMLTSESYSPAPYTISERYDHRSKKMRLIQRPKFFPDQVIHWLVVMVLEETFLRGMYYWNCGSVKGRGALHGQRAVRRWLKTDKKNTKYALKLDLRHYYNSIPHDRLMDRFKRKIKDKKMLHLISIILESCPQGIPIGNYTSQWFANFYLEGLDHHIKERLGAKYYVRYIDDLVIFGRNKKKLHVLRRELFKYIEVELGLTVKGNWQLFPLKCRGVDFLGYVFYRDHIKMRSRNFLAFTRQCRRADKKQAAGQPIAYRMAAGLLSRAGQLKHCDSYNIKKKYYNHISEKQLKTVVRQHSQGGYHNENNQYRQAIST